LILVWALPPIMLQTAFGADLLWQQRKLVGLTILTATSFLAASDSLAIGVGTWTIDPAQSLNLFVGGVLPFEELLFFFLTNVLITFGMTLALACASRTRARRMFNWHSLPPGECHQEVEGA
jgi:lycopene cyclase domain-containing protein